MAYEIESSYRRIFDQSQSPIFLDMLAVRHGADRQHFDYSDRPSDKTYLDFGCAQGHTILALAPLYPSIDFIGIDFNPRHISEANEEANRLGLTNTRFYQADFRSLPTDLPKADYLIARGIYSWLSSEVKQGLENAFTVLSKPSCLLKLHYSVRPGALFRESAMAAINLAIGKANTPNAGKKFLLQLIEEAPAFTGYFSAGHQGIEAMLKEPEETWRHDILNRDYRVEYANDVITRIEKHGFQYVGSTHYLKNFPRILVSDKFLPQLNDLPSADAQTLIDHLTSNGGRDDVFIRQPYVGGQSHYNTGLRYGLIVPEQKMAAPLQTVRGQVVFTREDCQSIIAALSKAALTFGELRSVVPSVSERNLVFWLDMLIAGNRVGPFLPVKSAKTVDRSRLRKINQERIDFSMKTFSEKTNTPLLAAEYGNCLVAGWFETLVLQNFKNRREIVFQREMLKIIHDAKIGFSSPDGQPAKDQLAAFQNELEKLEKNYLSKMEYWGIEV